jgi:GT2 family glycosyltransferase
MKVENVPAVTGAFMFVNKKDFIALNGFDEQYKVEAQDIDFCLKCIRMGKKIMFVNIDGITHVENGTRPKGSENPDDREYFLWKWRGFLNAAVLGTELNKEFKS